MCRSPKSFHVSSFKFGTDSLVNYYFDMRKPPTVHKVHLLNYEHHFEHGTCYFILNVLKNTLCGLTVNIFRANQPLNLQNECYIEEHIVAILDM